MDIKKYVDIVILAESKEKSINQDPLPYGKKDLDPVMSEATLKYHYDGLAAKYSERYNKGEGDSDFNYGGAMLHNIFFANLNKPKSNNNPKNLSKSLIEQKYENFDKFKEAIEKSAMAIQGSGWVYMDTSGEIKTIRNHEYKKNMKIALLIDWWEHAWALDYQQDKAKYLKNIWRIIDWEVVDIRLQGA